MQFLLTQYQSNDGTLKAVVRDIMLHNPIYLTTPNYDETELWSDVCQATEQTQKIGSVARYAWEVRSNIRTQ